MVVKALRSHPDDDVAVLLDSAPAGAIIEVVDSAETNNRDDTLRIEIVVDIPAAHKVALRDLPEGSMVRKFGYAIGRSTKAIQRGDHVHAHNIESLTTRSAPGPDATDRSPLFTAHELMAFAESVSSRAGAGPEAANAMATAMVEADLRGVHTHGLRRLPLYAQRLADGSVAGEAVPEFEIADSIIKVDGHNGPGHFVALRASEEVVRLSEKTGVAVATVVHSNHFGFAGYYASYIAEHDMIAVVTSNGTPCVAPPGGTAPFFSNNPLAIGAPLSEGFIEVDLAMSATSRAQLNQALEAGREIPPEWALGPDGKPTTDPRAGLEGTMQPFGGVRGFALLFGLEILSSVLGGAAVADQVAPKDKIAQPEGTGHFILGIRLDRFGDRKTFVDRLEAMIQRMIDAPRSSETAGITRYGPGQERWALRTERQKRGVPLAAPTVDSLQAVADQYGVRMPDAVSADSNTGRT